MPSNKRYVNSIGISISCGAMNGTRNMWGAVNQPTWQRRLYRGDPAG